MEWGVNKRRVEHANLHVDPDNVPAVNLYRKFGFKVGATLDDYYLQGWPALKMELDLS